MVVAAGDIVTIGDYNIGFDPRAVLGKIFEGSLKDGNLEGTLNIQI